MAEVTLKNIKKVLNEVLIPAGYLEYADINSLREEKGITLSLTK